MNKKQKFMFVFLQIITLGLIWIYWNSLKNKEENNLNKNTKISINIEKILNNIGQKENILKVESTYSKIKIFFKNKELIDTEEIKKIKGVSGVFINDKAIDIIVGNQAKAIVDLYFKN